MRFSKGADLHAKSAIAVNSGYTLVGIPEEAYHYTVNGKSAIEWLIDRYQVKTDKASGIVNDPNRWIASWKASSELSAWLSQANRSRVCSTGRRSPWQVNRPDSR